MAALEKSGHRKTCLTLAWASFHCEKEGGSMRALPIAVLGLVLSTVPALASDCTALTGTLIPKSAIGLPTSGAVVASASLVTDPRNGSYCKLLGGIKPGDRAAPDIIFQV